MRNWNHCCWFFFTPIFIVASLPMRNWNCLINSKISLWVWLRAYLWGIETFLQKNKRILLWRVASLPMRNWNPVPISLTCTKPPVASLPMRNWNPSVFAFVSLALLRCEPTYEELKPTSPTLNLSLPVCCEPTYEELKHNCFGAIQNHRQRLRAYLWGIETLFLLLLAHLLSALRAYLWGIETAIFHTFIRCFVYVASLPMRNWNYMQFWEKM